METNEATETGKPIEAKEAIALAKRYVFEYFAGEGITNVGLEEIEDAVLDWEVTIGFLVRGIQCVMRNPSSRAFRHCRDLTRRCRLINTVVIW